MARRAKPAGTAGAGSFASASSFDEELLSSLKRSSSWEVLGADAVKTDRVARVPTPTTYIHKLFVDTAALEQLFVAGVRKDDRLLGHQGYKGAQRGVKRGQGRGTETGAGERERERERDTERDRGTERQREGGQRQGRKRDRKERTKDRAAASWREVYEDRDGDRNRH